MAWLLIFIGAAIFIGIEVYRQKRRRAIRAVAVPIHNAASKPRPWWPAIVVTQIIGTLACWIVWRDMARDEPLWIAGLDSFLAIVAFGVIAGKVAPSHGKGSGEIAWGLSVAFWMLLMFGLALAGDGLDVLEDLRLITGGDGE